MNCSCGGITRALYRVHSETQRWMWEGKIPEVYQYAYIAKRPRKRG